MSTTPVVRAEHLRKSYGSTLAVQDVSLTVERGEIYGVLGRNGAGKTTTVEMIAGLRRPDGGTVEVLGLDPTTQAAALHERVGLQLQESAMPDRLRVREALDLYASFYPDPADPVDLLDLLGLTAKKDTAFKDLSGGQKQRLSVALALVGRPELAILDELTTGLDPHARRETWAVVEAIRDAGVTIILVTHLMEEAERLCDRIALIASGRVAAVGTPTEIVTLAQGEQVLRVRPQTPVADAVLLAAVAGVPDVRDAAVEDRALVVHGGGTVVQDVMVALARHDVRAQDVRLERASLEDAFVSLTGSDTAGRDTAPPTTPAATPTTAPAEV
ncbi:ABC transporter ATP-binding protein [Cellulomonas wangsupingiae]|uniref:ABC transporter ATP-binding protein n=1 Tax=Cellulomonas wangsupingiae TaxID=2968085 RepID=A0ABY5K4K5_9CELL|nr:ABC transporter ATP-binding protein [Cellulomonas wangsupingiae]MCC2336412.1 ABC transporter ATP-binding protein [Cellulomonas wangsupingiae]UUI64704.1 ABC transporter ATP-binding protein [Cellulomonas wangsupingiae]